MLIKLKYSVVCLAVLQIWACSSMRFNKDRAAFTASAVLTKYKAVTDMNDAYFEIKENNYFEFYRTLFDSVKNTSYPGKYEKKGDTLFLHFYDKKGNTLLGTKALLNPIKKEIIFFENATRNKKNLF